MSEGFPKVQFYYIEFHDRHDWTYERWGPYPTKEDAIIKLHMLNLATDMSKYYDKVLTAEGELLPDGRIVYGSVVLNPVRSPQPLDKNDTDSIYCEF
jgi:hypothetical protein